MKQEVRTTKVLRNITFSAIYKVVDVLMSFALRTVFVFSLGETYLGLSGLFANVLTVLSLMELGVGGAIIFSLYKPIAEGNEEKVCSLMRLYRNCYLVLGCLIGIAGVAIIPLLPVLVNLPSDLDNVNEIYLITLLDTVSTYFFSYKRSLLIADQRSDIDAKIQTVFRVIRFLGLSVLLLAFKNYILYLVFNVVNNIATNICISVVTDRRYPYLKQKKVKPLEQTEKKNILKFISSGVLFKIGQTVVNGTDSILISLFIGTLFVGYYSNYLVILSGLEILVFLIFNAMTASIGNVAVTESNEHAEKLFRRVFYGNYFLSSFLSICLFCLINPFVSLWLGDRYLLPTETVVVLSLNFYMSTMQKGAEDFISAVGELFYKNRFKSVVECISNLAFSILLVKVIPLGITGVFLGTTACFLCGRVWMDARVLYKYWFHRPVGSYLVKYFSLLALTLGLGFGAFVLSDWLFGLLGCSILSWLGVACLLACLLSAILLLLFGRTEEFAYYKDLLLKRIFRLKKTS